MKTKITILTVAILFSMIFISSFDVRGFIILENDISEKECDISESNTMLITEKSLMSTNLCPKEKDPIIFVHGIGLGVGSPFNSIWRTMRNRLEKEGWEGRTFEINYTFKYSWAGMYKSNVDDAKKLSIFVDRVLNETGAEKVDLICHSMGGLSARYYIKFLGGDQKVDDYISIATPQKGSNDWWYLNFISWLTVGNWEMRYDSKFLKNLNAGDMTPGDIDYTTISSTADDGVPPEDAFLDDTANTLIVNKLSHDGMPKDPMIIDYIKNTLN